MYKVDKRFAIAQIAKATDFWSIFSNFADPHLSGHLTGVPKRIA